MAKNQCIIDDFYCISMGNYFKKQGEQLDKMISEYISVMKNAQMFGLRNGETHDAMQSYIDYAEKLRGKFSVVSENAQSQVTKFISQVDEADQYLF